MQSNISKTLGFSFLEILISLAVFSLILSALIFTEYKSAKAINEDYRAENSRILTHNTYESEYYR